MPMRWDPLLAAATARELARSLTGARVRAFLMDPFARNVLLFLREGTVVLELHPLRGWLSILPAIEPHADARRVSGRILDARALPDESVLIFQIGRRGRGLELIAEMVGNRWNAVVVEEANRTIRHVLTPRETGARSMVAGARYEPPTSTGRVGVDELADREAWEKVAGSDDAGEESRRRALLRGVAWTSSLNVEGLTGAHGWERWREMVDSANWSAYNLRTARGLQPYPIEVAGCEADPTPSLVEAMALARAADSQAGHPAELLVPSRVVERAVGRARRAARRADALRRELEASGDPAEQRALGDLILARFVEIPRGAGRTTLTGFEGEPVVVELDPLLTPSENAARHYAEAARLERARAALPRRIARADAEAARWHDRLDAVREGRAPWQTLADALGPDPKGVGSPARREAPTLPYRRFVSSGGIEIRVGRGARQNDDLTFHHSDPDDIWLHARQAAGAHVILRWGRKEGPPRRDLLEAATLAAWNSEARHSGSVPVVWTRRKYVRKPRKAPPGSVRPERVEALMVEPDPTLPGRLAPDSGDD